ncbi:MAG: acyl-CoA thioesterase [Clostridiales bacterium]
MIKETKEKIPKDSYVETREMVLPNDTNLLGNLLGGRLLHLIDIAGAMVASKHSNKIVATVSIDNVNFKEPIKLGEIIILRAVLVRVGRSSMDVLVRIYGENTMTGKIINTNSAFLTYVALDDDQKPTLVPRLKITTEEEQKYFEEANKRKKKRLETDD